MKHTEQTTVEAFRIPRIKHKKLGRQKAWGEQYTGTSLILLDPRMRSKRYLNILIHEMLHLYFPDLTEHTTDHLAKAFSKEIWSKRYRRIEK